ncbi:unnamed protein product [Amoebophrya sp. A120]|nr:unnamed protein product [Amoebophrya sp. A120]|eukprot:GSA120T00016986001.1
MLPLQVQQKSQAPSAGASEDEQNENQTQPPSPGEEVRGRGRARTSKGFSRRKCETICGRKTDSCTPSRSTRRGRTRSRSSCSGVVRSGTVSGCSSSSGSSTSSGTAGLWSWISRTSKPLFVIFSQARRCVLMFRSAEGAAFLSVLLVGTFAAWAATASGDDREGVGVHPGSGHQSDAAQPVSTAASTAHGEETDADSPHQQPVSEQVMGGSARKDHDTELQGEKHQHSPSSASATAAANWKTPPETSSVASTTAVQIKRVARGQEDQHQSQAQAVDDSHDEQLLHAGEFQGPSEARIASLEVGRQRATTAEDEETQPQPLPPSTTSIGNVRLNLIDQYQANSQIDESQLPSGTEMLNRPARITADGVEGGAASRTQSQRRDTNNAKTSSVTATASASPTNEEDEATANLSKDEPASPGVKRTAQQEDVKMVSAEAKQGTGPEAFPGKGENEDHHANVAEDHDVPISSGDRRAVSTIPPENKSRARQKSARSAELSDPGAGGAPANQEARNTFSLQPSRPPAPNTPDRHKGQKSAGQLQLTSNPGDDSLSLSLVQADANTDTKDDVAAPVTIPQYEKYILDQGSLSDFEIARSVSRILAPKSDTDRNAVSSKNIATPKVKIGNEAKAKASAARMQLRKGQLGRFVDEWVLGRYWFFVHLVLSRDTQEKISRLGRNNFAMPLMPTTFLPDRPIPSNYGNYFLISMKEIKDDDEDKQIASTATTSAKPPLSQWNIDLDNPWECIIKHLYDGRVIWPPVLDYATTDDELDNSAYGGGELTWKQGTELAALRPKLWTYNPSQLGEYAEKPWSFQRDITSLFVKKWQQLHEMLPLTKWALKNSASVDAGRKQEEQHRQLQAKSMEKWTEDDQLDRQKQELVVALQCRTKLRLQLEKQILRRLTGLSSEPIEPLGFLKDASDQKKLHDALGSYVEHVDEKRVRSQVNARLHETLDNFMKKKGIFVAKEPDYTSSSLFCCGARKENYDYTYPFIYRLHEQESSDAADAAATTDGAHASGDGQSGNAEPLGLKENQERFKEELRRRNALLDKLATDVGSTSTSENGGQVRGGGQETSPRDQLELIQAFLVKVTVKRTESRPPNPPQVQAQTTWKERWADSMQRWAETVHHFLEFEYINWDLKTHGERPRKTTWTYQRGQNSGIGFMLDETFGDQRQRPGSWSSGSFDHLLGDSLKTGNEASATFLLTPGELNGLFAVIQMQGFYEGDFYQMVGKGEGELTRAGRESYFYNMIKTSKRADAHPAGAAQGNRAEPAKAPADADTSSGATKQDEAQTRQARWSQAVVQEWETALASERAAPAEHESAGAGGAGGNARKAKDHDNQGQQLQLDQLKGGDVVRWNCQTLVLVLGGFFGGTMGDYYTTMNGVWGSYVLGLRPPEYFEAVPEKPSVAERLPSVAERLAARFTGWGEMFSAGTSGPGEEPARPARPEATAPGQGIGAVSSNDPHPFKDAGELPPGGTALVELRLHTPTPSKDNSAVARSVAALPHSQQLPSGADELGSVEPGATRSADYRSNDANHGGDRGAARAPKHSDEVEGAALGKVMSPTKAELVSGHASGQALQKASSSAERTTSKMSARTASTVGGETEDAEVQFDAVGGLSPVSPIKETQTASLPPQTSAHPRTSHAGYRGSSSTSSPSMRVTDVRPEPGASGFTEVAAMHGDLAGAEGQTLFANLWSCIFSSPATKRHQLSNHDTTFVEKEVGRSMTVSSEKPTSHVWDCILRTWSSSNADHARATRLLFHFCGSIALVLVLSIVWCCGVRGSGWCSKKVLKDQFRRILPSVFRRRNLRAHPSEPADDEDLDGLETADEQRALRQAGRGGHGSSKLFMVGSAGGGDTTYDRDDASPVLADKTRKCNNYGATGLYAATTEDSHLQQAEPEDCGGVSGRVRNKNGPRVETEHDCQRSASYEKTRSSKRNPPAPCRSSPASGGAWDPGMLNKADTSKPSTSSTATEHEQKHGNYSEQERDESGVDNATLMSDLFVPELKVDELDDGDYIVRENNYSSLAFVALPVPR